MNTIYHTLLALTMKTFKYDEKDICVVKPSELRKAIEYLIVNKDAPDHGTIHDDTHQRKDHHDALNISKEQYESTEKERNDTTSTINLDDTKSKTRIVSEKH